MATKKAAGERVKAKGQTPEKAGYKVSLEELLEAGAHFGHQVRRWNPKMSKYIWAERDGVHIFDLAKTAQKLEEALAYLKQAAQEGKRIVIVGTKRQAQPIVLEMAKEAKIHYITERWLGGLITNWDQIKKRLQKLADLKDKKEKGLLVKYTKKEQLLFDREINRLERFFGGLTGLSDKPEVIFVVDTHKEKVAVREAVAKGIKVVGICDSNADCELVDYPIPANDDAVKSIELIVKAVVETIKEGRKNVGKD